MKLETLSSGPRGVEQTNAPHGGDVGGLTMANGEWKPRKLDELGFLGRGKSRHRPRNDASLYGGSYPFIQTADVMAADPYITSYSQTYSELGFQQSKMWPPGTLCMTIAGANTAKTAILKIEACFPDSIVGFIPDKSKSDLHFIKYSLDLMRNRFLSVSRGATQDNLGLDKILSFPIFAPEVEVQRRIGAILSAYDELMENSQRRIRILEAMARALYREWFVHFRFPGHETHSRVPSPLGHIPKGWDAAPLASLVDFAKGRKPSETRKEAIPGDVPLLLIDSLRGGEAEFTSPLKLVLAETRDTIMVMDGASSCDVTLGFSGAVGSTLGRFRTTRLESFSPHALYRFLEAEAEEFKSKNIGAAIPHANKDYILTQLVAVPPPAIALRFHNQLEPLQGAIETLKAQIQNLRRTRDLLLPRLLSGQVARHWEETL